MSDEITIQGSLRYALGNLTGSVELTQQQIDMATQLLRHEVLDLDTSYEALAMGDLTETGIAIFKNLDATNYVLISLDSGSTEHLRLLAGEWCLVRLPPATDLADINVKSNVTAKFEYWIFNT
jgi:hypothetical protein